MGLTVAVPYISRHSHGFRHLSSHPHLRRYESTPMDFHHSLAHLGRKEALYYPGSFQSTTFRLDATKLQVCLTHLNAAEASSLCSRCTSCMQTTQEVTLWNKLPSLWHTSECEMLPLIHVTSSQLSHRSIHFNMVHCQRRRSGFAVFSITAVNAATAFVRA